jgi:hypothetical protein
MTLTTKEICPQYYTERFPNLDSGFADFFGNYSTSA